MAPRPGLPGPPAPPAGEAPPPIVVEVQVAEPDPKPMGCGSFVLYFLAAVLGLYVGFAMLVQMCRAPG